jgi:hypothetical protein
VQKLRELRRDEACGEVVAAAGSRRYDDAYGFCGQTPL